MSKDNEKINIVIETNDYEKNNENLLEKNELLQKKIKELEQCINLYKTRIIEDKENLILQKNNIKNLEIQINEETQKVKNINEITDKYNFLKTRLKINHTQFKKDIIIARYSYHEIYNKNWLFTILILIFSSLISFIEAIRLIVEKYKIENIIYISTGFNILSLFIGLLITIFSGYVKFNDYQKKLETISSRLSQLTLYKKKFDLIYFELNMLNNFELNKLNDTIENDKDNIKKLDDAKINEMITNISKIEEEVQNNELLKYITEETHIKFYGKYLDTILKNNIHDNFIKGINKILEYDETLLNINDNKDIKMNNELNNKQFKINLLNTLKKIIEKYKEHNTFTNKVKRYFNYNEYDAIIMDNEIQKIIKDFFYNNK